MQDGPTAEIKSSQEQVMTLIGRPPETIRVNDGTVYMYSGESFGNGGGQDDWNIARVKNHVGVEVLLAMRPSPGHRPMDAASVFMRDDGSVSWVKADGVSNIGTEPNRSGKLAEVMAGGVYMDNLNRPGGGADAAHEFMRSGGEAGATTYEYGKIEPASMGFDLRAVKVGSGRERENGQIKGGSFGPTESYYSSEQPGGYDELWDRPGLQRDFVGHGKPKVESLKRNFSNDEQLTITACTDGVRMLVKGWSNSGMVVERAIRKGADTGTLSFELERLRQEGYFSPIDDISLVAIRLPGKSAKF